ncbi:hypothetical protein [Noviherbaspirillum sp. Root189]|uniref:hypothetical protein n=1 Tax=Noviherbaspirillum sp. Root189 TaxID=1736487 RepID=UPI0012E36FAE|nr:hypothetical protein [Noviherbaspirillum sp. Root189]
MINTDYLYDAFNGLEPHKDKDAAIKFCLNAVLMDCRFADLETVMRDGADIGGMEGPPGWIIERCDEGATKGYEDWPESARFRAFVDPESYELAYPEFFCDKPTVEQYVRAAIRAYCNRHPERNKETALILQTLSR